MNEKHEEERPWKWTGVPDGSGILAIRNTKTGRCYYLGVSDFRQRAFDHHRLLTRGEHHNPELQKDWTADPSSFRFVVVETVKKPTLLCVFKQVWIERDENPYNRKNAVPIAS